MLLIEMIVGLILIQLSRVGFTTLLQFLNVPIILSDCLSFLFLGVILFFIFKPDRKSLGLELRAKKKVVKIIYTVATIFVILLLITTILFFSEGNVDNVLMTLKGVVIIPVFEELLFRGFLWNKLTENKIKEIHAYIIITVLFGLWHLGYWDIIYYNASMNFADIHMGEIMFYKVLFTMAFGIVCGFVRLKTKNTYSGILVHSFLNVFGR